MVIAMAIYEWSRTVKVKYVVKTMNVHFQIFQSTQDLMLSLRMQLHVQCTCTCCRHAMSDYIDPSGQLNSPVSTSHREIRRGIPQQNT